MTVSSFEVVWNVAFGSGAVVGDILETRADSGPAGGVWTSSLEAEQCLKQKS